MHRLYVIISVNSILLGLIALILSLVIIHSAELSIISSSFLMLGIVMLPIGLGLESSTEKLLKIKAKEYDNLVHRIIEEFLVFDRKPIFCPSNICNISSILIPIGKSTIKVSKISNRLITLFDDMVTLMIEAPGVYDFKNVIKQTSDLHELNENINDIISSILMLATNVKVSIKESEYTVTIDGVRTDINRNLGPYNALILLVGGILSEQLGKKLLLKSFEVLGDTITMVFKEV